MKIIKKGNFDRESVSDVLIAENVSEYWGEQIVKTMNETHSGPNSDVWFLLVVDTYQYYER